MIYRNHLCFLFILSVFFSCDYAKKPVFVMYYFEGKAGDRAGLYMAYSYDMKSWHELGGPIINPKLGEWKVFRDPSVIQSKDGIFHLTWTAGSSGIGMAHSEEGANWKDFQYVDLEDSSRDMTFANCWAPEFYQEADTTYIIFSATLKKDYRPPANPDEWYNATWNHQLFYTKTTDFVHFEPVEKFWNPEYKAIDAVLHKTDSLYYLFFKDERNSEEIASSKSVVMGSSRNLMGPYENVISIAGFRTEGAIPIKAGDSLILYYDYYDENNGYRYKSTTDMSNWGAEQTPVKDGFDDIFRHGAIIEVDEVALKRMKRFLSK